MDRNHQRNKNRPGFNMISLMDIFTILVFFLLVNSSDVQMNNTKTIKLPESIADQKPRETVTILVSKTEIWVQDRRIASVADAQRVEGPVIPELKQELDILAGLRRYEDTSETGSEVTIMGDREIPFSLLKKIMTTCTQANFGRISFSVAQSTVDS